VLRKRPESCRVGGALDTGLLFSGKVDRDAVASRWNNGVLHVIPLNSIQLVTILRTDRPLDRRGSLRAGPEIRRGIRKSPGSSGGEDQTNNGLNTGWLNPQKQIRM